METAEECVWFHQFTDDKFGKRQNMVPHIDKDTNPDNVILYFAAVVTLLLKIIWYCQHYLYIQTVGCLQYMTWLNMKSFFSGEYYSTGTWHMRQLEILFWLLCRSLWLNFSFIKPTYIHLRQRYNLSVAPACSVRTLPYSGILCTSVYNSKWVKYITIVMLIIL